MIIIIEKKIDIGDTKEERRVNDTQVRINRKKKNPMANFQKKYHFNVGNGLISLIIFSPSCNSNGLFMIHNF